MEANLRGQQEFSKQIRDSYDYLVELEKELF